MDITFQNISKQYKRKYALQDFSAELHEGVYGLLGANGAGKTTLINIFVGILKHDSGRILINGTDTRILGKDFLSLIGYMPQYPVFYPNFKVLDFLEYMCALKGIPTNLGRKRAMELLEIVNLNDAINKKIGALSGGMRQRVGIVQAMLGDPKILILDEPTAGLDPQERIRFRNLITKFSKGRTVLLATHIVSDVECIANEVLILKQGQLIRQKPIQELEDEIYGKVWSLTATDNMNFSQFEDKRISNIHRQGNQISLRIIANEQPDITAMAMKPNLEDVFLYYFGGDNT